MGTPPQYIGALLIPIFSFALGLDAGPKFGAGWEDANRGSKMSRRATHLTARGSSAGPRKRRSADETDICRGRNVCVGGIAAFDCRPSIESRGYSITVGRRPPKGLMSASPHKSIKPSREGLADDRLAPIRVGPRPSTCAGWPVKSPYAFAASFTRYARTSVFETGFVAKGPILCTPRPALQSRIEGVDPEPGGGEKRALAPVVDEVRPLGHGLVVQALDEGALVVAAGLAHEVGRGAAEVLLPPRRAIGAARRFDARGRGRAAVCRLGEQAGLARR